MCENSAVSYSDGEVVWVKLGSSWWPGEVVGFDKLPPDVLPSMRKPPIAVVKFFQEDAYEYVKNANSIYKYDCSKKNEFINKGLNLYRTKHGAMDKFPEDVVRAETATGGDVEILSREEFQEKKRESYAGIFGDPVKKTAASVKKGKGARGRPEDPRTPMRKSFEKNDYKVHILVQGSKTPSAENEQPASETPETPSTSADQESDNKKSEPQETEEKEKPIITSKPTTFSTPTASSSGIYACHACQFTTTRLNVLILHNKTHSVSFMPYTPSPIRKKITPKSPTKSTPEATKTPKARKPRKEKADKEPKKVSTPIQKRPAEEQTINTDVKKVKTDEEIKSSLLADWDDGDDADEEYNEGPSPVAMAKSPEVSVPAESPAVPTSAELSSMQPSPAELSSMQPSPELSSPVKSSNSPSSEKVEASTDASKYEFCEDEDWPLEADGGRKIPRVKNPKRKEDTKSVSIDDEDMAREVAELLNKTTVPELPSAPEPLKVEENFPEPSIVKSPDKEKPSEKSEDKPPETQPTKAIFKTKTFFRSRHSRSQDAIGKYVAEQLNAVERMDIADSDINGSEAVSSPETRESPPIEQVKVARLAPKIQLKKMKAEAAQLREKEKSTLDYFNDFDLKLYGETVASNSSPVLQSDSIPTGKGNDVKLLQDVLYPTQEIKPVNTDLTDQIKSPTEKLKYVDENSMQKDVSTEVNSEVVEDQETNELHEPEVIDINKEPKQMDVDRELEKNPEEQVDDPMQDSESIVVVQEVYNDEVIQETELNEVAHEMDVSNVAVDSEIIEKSKINATIEEPIVETVIIVSDTKEVVEEPQEMHNIVEEPEIHNIQEQSINDVVQESEIYTNIQESDKHNTVHEPATQDVQKLEVCTSIQEPAKEIKNDFPSVETQADDQLSKTDIQESYEKPVEPYMNESTASAVDALLSVSREADRVTRIISDDPPEDLFEDDNRDNNVNGFNDCMNIENGVNEVKYSEPVKYLESTTELNSNSNEFTASEKSQDIVMENILDDNNIISTTESVSNNIESTPSESDLQIAETLINLPSTAIQSKTSTDHQTDNLNLALSNESSQDEIVHSSDEMGFFDKSEDSSQELIIPKSKSLLISNNENKNIRFETEQEKSENLNAAQSLVQMSESIDHKINIDHNIGSAVSNKDIIIPDTGAFNIKQNNILSSINKPEQKVAIRASDNNNDSAKEKNVKIGTSSSKLLKILEEPCVPKLAANKPTIIKQNIISGKEKILNFDVAKSSSFKGRSDSPKQKIIIRRTTSSKNIMNNIADITTPDKIILSRSKNPAQDGSVQTYTIQTSPEASTDSNAIIIQQKVRKISKPPVKLQKIKTQTSLVTPIAEAKIINETTSADTMFDINSMPIVLSEDLLTPESIEKMPIVMSDGNIITHTPNPPKLVKTKQPIESEKIAISATPSKPEVKTLLMNQVTEVNKVTTPNILSKSSKLRAAKPMLVIDKTTGKQKIIMTKGESTVKEVKQTPTLIQSVPQNTAKEKFIILPTQSTPRPGGRTQKIVIDPQTGKAHVLVAKAPETQPNASDSKPVSAKIVPSPTDTACTTGNTVMIITNAQGAQSRIVLTPEHEKMLFPKKQQPNVTGLKTIAHRITTNPGAASKSVITSIPPAKPQNVAPAKLQNVAPAKMQTRIVPKQQKSAIITSKGQLIVGGRVATTAQNIAPMPVPKRIMASEPKKLVQTIQKASSEPLIFLQQKSGAVMQLTAAQFEHLQRTGQIVQKVQAPENKVIVQKTITVNEPTLTPMHKPRARKTVTESQTPLKRIKHEIAIAPATASPVPTLSPLSNTSTTLVVPSISNTVSVSTTSTYPEFDNFEELLPSTAIARQHEPAIAPVASPVVEPQAPVTAPPPGPISDGQLIAVPGEHFGGPAGSFYLCMEDNGTFTPIDHRPLVLDNNQLVPMAEPVQVLGTQPERRDILEAALANSDVFHADPPRDEAPDFRDLNANVSVHCRVSETSTTLNQPPIMTPVEVPSIKIRNEPTVPSNLEDGLAVIGVTPHVPTSLELPITVTDPRIAPKTTDPLSSGSAFGTAGLMVSPNTEMSFVTNEETDIPMGEPISMPLLTDDESMGGGKSMPILTDDLTERTVSSIDSAVGSPSSIDVRESENEDGGQWTRRLLTPGSDTSDASAEIPLQPAIQLSVTELSRHS